MTVGADMSIVGRSIRNLHWVFLISFTGCASIETSQTSVPVVPVEAVINTLKCGFARVLDSDHRRRSGLFGGVANIELDVNVVQGVDASGSVSVGIPVFAGAGTITPSFSITHSEVRTINSSVDFDINLRSHGISICRTNSVGADADSGFSSWIAAVVSGIDNAVEGPPTAQLTKYVYESDFTVKTGGTAGLDVEIVPVKLSTSAGSSRSDIQHLKITIDAVTLVKDKDGKIKVAKKGPAFLPFGFGGTPDGRERRGTFNLPSK